jgi:two-component system response regulator ChvI
MHVTDFGDPHAALKFSLDQPPDLAILDVFMPGMSGLELARRIRQKHSQVRVLFCSGSLGPDGQLPGGEVLAEPFLQKPFDLDVLRQMVGACLRVAEVA